MLREICRVFFELKDCLWCDLLSEEWRSVLVHGGFVEFCSYCHLEKFLAGVGLESSDVAGRPELSYLGNKVLVDLYRSNASLLSEKHSSVKNSNIFCLFLSFSFSLSFSHPLSPSEAEMPQQGIKLRYHVNGNNVAVDVGFRSLSCLDQKSGNLKAMAPIPVWDQLHFFLVSSHCQSGCGYLDHSCSVTYLTRKFLLPMFFMKTEGAKALLQLSQMQHWNRTFGTPSVNVGSGNNEKTALRSSQVKRCVLILIWHEKPKLVHAFQTSVSSKYDENLWETVSCFVDYPDSCSVNLLDWKLQ